MKATIKTFSVESLTNYSKEPEGNTISMPTNIYQECSQLCYKTNETVGWLIARKTIVSNYIVYLVEYVLMSNEGDEGSVYQNVLPKIDNEYELIEFHTHTISLGSGWYNKLSGKDIKTIKKRLSILGKEYKHVLFTPTHVLTVGTDNPNIIVSRVVGQDAIDENSDRYNYWKNRLQ